jgi:hypothetical protein
MQCQTVQDTDLVESVEQGTNTHSPGKKLRKDAEGHNEDEVF